MKNITEQAINTLNNDGRFNRNYRRIRSTFTSGAMPAAQFRSIVQWQIADCFRREGLPLRTARAMQRAAACRLTPAAQSVIHC